jgi:photosystem II stability/assembly factor-like uncharacterized protein
MFNKVYTICVIFSITFFYPLITNAQWNKIYTNNIQDLYDVQLIDGYAFAVGQTNTILKSTDAGKSWKNQFISIPTHLRAIYFIDTLTGFVTGENARLFKTSNGGKTWTSKFVRTAAYAYGLHFNNNNGLLVGANLLITSTTDLGETWTVDTTYNANITLKGVGITPNGTCYAVGEKGTLLKKHISQKKWEKINLNETIHLNEIRCISDADIIIVGGMPDTSQVGKHFNRLIYSNDSGNTWQKINISEMKSIYSAWFKNKDTGFLGGSNGIISKSYNLQNNRGQQLTGIASDINGLSFYNNIGLAVSYGGTILRTENNGGSGLSLKNNSIKPFLIYPQPSSGNIKLESSFEISKISSISIDGKTNEYLIDDNKSVEISNLKSGIYTLKIELSNGDIYWEKISVITP